MRSTKRREDIDPERVREALEAHACGSLFLASLKVSGLSLVNRADVYRVGSCSVWVLPAPCIAALTC